MAKKKSALRKGIVITFVNEKGGVGKTTCCFNVAWEMANQGKKILMIDMDGQTANLTFFCGVDKTDEMKTVTNVLLKPETVEKVILNIRDGLDLLPSDIEASSINPSVHRVSALRKAIKAVVDQYDYIFMDVNPSPNWGQTISLAASDYVIMPMLPDVTSLAADTGTMESIKVIREEQHEDLKVLGVVFVKFTTQTNLSKDVHASAKKLAAMMGGKVFTSTIRQAVVMSECVSNHEGITDYAPNSKVAEEIRNLVKEIEKEVERREHQ